MASFILWYLVLFFVGIITFPISFRLFSTMPGRAYPLIRPLGMILWAYIFWIMVSLGVIANNPGGAIFALLVILFISGWQLQKNIKEIFLWVSQNSTHIIKVELLFVILFGSWAIVRAANPDIIGTEKPMEMAFINSILRSTSFPPQDPWLSGYAISYYYFGYVMVALMAQLTGVSGSTAFNLAIALWFGMTGVGIYGVVYELLGLNQRSHGITKPVQDVYAIFSPFLILILSNFEGFLEMLHAKGIFWQKNSQGVLSSKIWTWLDIQELTSPPLAPFSWIPERVGGIWWWRTSRVLQDYDLAGRSKEIIDEVPIFSFLLADLHPHILAMPFVILIIMLCMAFYFEISNKKLLGLKSDESPVQTSHNWKITLREIAKNGPFGLPLYWVSALVIGGLAFLNTWDFPIYVLLFSGTYALVRYQDIGWNPRLIVVLIFQALVIGILGVILYFPFYLGFSSQAGGILPSLAFFTRGIHFWVMFGSLIIPLLIWLVEKNIRSEKKIFLKQGFLFSLVLIGGLWMISYGSGLFMTLLSKIGPITPIVNIFLGLQGAANGSELLAKSIILRLEKPGMWVTIILLLTLTWSAFQLYRKTRLRFTISEYQKEGQGSTTNERIDISPEPFVLLLTLVGIGLVTFPEYFYLRDQFGWRMNTIFKFYFQSWILWGIASSYAIYKIFNWKNTLIRVICKIMILISLGFSAAYPIFGIFEKIKTTQPENWTLDGLSYINKYSIDEMDAINWLKQAPMGVIAEAIGGSYSNFARISTHSGMPTVLGWPGHESQWRGGAEEIGSRESDIETLFRSSKWDEILPVIQKYNIRYVYIGELEKSKYQANEKFFVNHLYPVYKNASVKIFEVPEIFLIPCAGNENY